MREINPFLTLVALVGLGAALAGSPAFAQRGAVAPMAAAPTSISGQAGVSLGMPQVGPANNTMPVAVGAAGAAGQVGAPNTNGQFGGTFNTQAPANMQSPLNMGMGNSAGVNGMGERFGNAPLNTSLGNLQLSTQGNSAGGAMAGSTNSGYSFGASGPTVGGVNGAGPVFGGFQSGGVENFQNGGFAVGGFDRGNGTGGGAFPGPTTYGISSPNFQGLGGATGVYQPGTPAAVYGFNPAPNVTGGYNPAPPIGLEQSTTEGSRFQYGGW
jgi:hypothetical protein